MKQIGLFKNENVQIPPRIGGRKEPLCLFSTSTIQLSVDTNNSFPQGLKSSTDKIDWTDVDANNNNWTINNSSLYFKANQPTNQNWQGNSGNANSLFNFVNTSAELILSGDLFSLYNWSKELPEYAFNCLFAHTVGKYIGIHADQLILAPSSNHAGNLYSHLFWKNNRNNIYTATIGEGTFSNTDFTSWMGYLWQAGFFVEVTTHATGIIGGDKFTDYMYWGNVNTINLGTLPDSAYQP